MRYKVFDTLCEDARRIREEVFVREQGFRNEFDETDRAAAHVVFYDQDLPVAVCRYFKGAGDGEYVAGRIAVLREHRGRNAGKEIMGILEEIIASQGGKYISLSAQMRVQGFYEKNGYVPMGDPYYDEYCLHIHMEKRLTEKCLAEKCLTEKR